MICTPRTTDAANALAAWALRVVEKADDPKFERKPYVRVKQVRRGHKRGRYAKKAVAA